MLTLGFVFVFYNKQVVLMNSVKLKDSVGHLEALMKIKTN